MGALKIIHTAGRHNCGARCSFTARVKDGVVQNISFEPEKTPCVKYCLRGHHYLDTLLSDKRLLYPMRRTGVRGEGRFERISWDEAVTIIASEWKRITGKYGPGSRYINYSSGVAAVARPDVFAKRLAALDGGYLGYYNSYSTACTKIATEYVYGTYFSGNSSIFLKKSKLIILWAHNPRETLFGAYLMDELRSAKKQGTRIIVIDPRRSATAEYFDAEWFPIRPGTDSALSDAMAYVILSEGLEDRRFIDAYCLGFDEAHLPSGVPANESYESYLFGKKDGVEKTPAWGEAITGLPASRIAELARSYATAKPAALLAGWGAQRHSNGEQSVRGTAMLACLTGNTGREGGGSGGADFVGGYPKPAIPLPSNPYGAAIPSFLWTDAVLRGEQMTAKDDGVRGVERLKSSVKLIFNLAGNMLINQHSDCGRSAGILRDTAKCEFIVVSDLFMTPSARFADILLPAPSFLEAPNITFPYDEGDYLLHNNPVISPPGESCFEYDWLKELARELGLYDEFTCGHENAGDWLRTAYENLRANSTDKLPPYRDFKEAGGYFYPQRTRTVAFREQIENGVPFPTPSGKIEIFSPRLYALQKTDIPALPCYAPGFENSADPGIKEYPFQLIGWHSKRRCHSIHDNNHGMDKIEAPFVEMNAADAAPLGIHDGDMCEVWNARGRIRIGACLTDNIMRGVLATSQGAWWTPDEDGVDIRGNINTLTTQRPTPLAKGNPQHSNLVNIRKM